MDDVLIYAETVEKLEKITSVVLNTMKLAGIKLNRDKCLFNRNNVTFLGHEFTADGLKADTKKLEAIANIPALTNKLQLQRFIGIINYFYKFIPNYSQQTEPLRVLLAKNVAWF